MTKILIVDDHELILESLKSIINQSVDMQVIGTASNGIEAMEYIKENTPDLVITDIFMPFCDGIRLTSMIKDLNPQIKVLALTIFDDEQTVGRILEAKVDGFITKDLSAKVVLSAIRNTIDGLTVLESHAYGNIIKNISSDEYKQAKIMEETGLSNEEISIVRLVAKGYSNVEISKSLYFSQNTVKHKLTGIMAKLGINDRVQLAVYAAKKGIV